LNLHRISAVIFDGNIPSLRAAEASGFRKEGIMKDLFFKDGVYHSAFMMAVLDKDFKRIMSKENV
jgi:RimJ/RimL family protein N-acetyltransferase